MMGGTEGEGTVEGVKKREEEQWKTVEEREREMGGNDGEEDVRKMRKGTSIMALISQVGDFGRWQMCIHESKSHS